MLKYYDDNVYGMTAALAGALPGVDANQLDIDDAAIALLAATVLR